MSLPQTRQQQQQQQLQQSQSQLPVGPSLLATGLSDRQGPYQLAIAIQPEVNHRARYLTEGSRGSVKGRSRRGYPAIQLTGWLRPAQVCVFVATDSGRVKPHSHYQACLVSGKATAAKATECDRDGTKVLAVGFDPREGPVFSIDCIGILKLRNMDVNLNHRACVGGQKRGAAVKESQNGGNGDDGSARARLVFRVCLPVDWSDSCVVLQVASEPIVCSQPMGSPETLRVSASEGPSHGGADLFVIGKNFARGSRVIFREPREPGSGNAAWEAEAPIEADYLNQGHMICQVPPYRTHNLQSPVTVQVTVHNGGKVSEPFLYTYKPSTGLQPQSASSLGH